MPTTDPGRPGREPAAWTRFDTDAHRAAQITCRHLFHCAVDGTTRRVVSQMLDYARGVGDSNLIVLTLVQLGGPCTLPADGTD
jgi:hypothetical protein